MTLFSNFQLSFHSLKRILFFMMVMHVVMIQSLWACSCHSILSFDLYEYDEARLIIEVEVIDMIKDKNIISFDDEKRMAKWYKLFPPQPPPPRKFYADFRIKVKEIYKGELQCDNLVLRADDIFSSCAWEPEVGTTYIFYIRHTSVWKNIEVLQISGACDRKIYNSSTGFSSEKKILRFLKQKRNGRFRLHQRDLMSKPSLLSNYVVLEGGFKNKERHGVWKLYTPKLGYRDPNVCHTVLALTYFQGRLFKVEEYPVQDSWLQPHLSWWARYYEGNLSNFGEE